MASRKVRGYHREFWWPFFFFEIRFLNILTLPERPEPNEHHRDQISS